MTQPPGPADVANASHRSPLPRRFYKAASLVEERDGFALTLDGKPARTPGGAKLLLPSRAIGDETAAEWNAQAEFIDPVTMPLTRIANSALDAVARREEAVRKDIVAYAGNDLVCYRASAPAGLVARQVELWDPLLDWADRTLGARLVTGEGIVPLDQSDDAIAAVANAVAPFAVFPLTALHIATTLTGSAILSLAMALCRLTVESAWEAAHVDEDWQIAQWGEVGEATARREARWREMKAAALILDGA
jgi:chaperone required for assembly of F1-ATPase